MSVSTSPAAPLVAAKESTSNPLPVSSGSAEAVPSSAAGSVAVPEAAIAPVMFVGRGHSAPTVLLLSASQVVYQPPAPSAAVSETTGSTQLVLKPAASPEWTPQDVPSPDSSSASDVDSAQEKVWCFCAVFFFFFRWLNLVDSDLSESKFRFENLKTLKPELLLVLMSHSGGDTVCTLRGKHAIRLVLLSLSNRLSQQL